MLENEKEILEELREYITLEYWSLDSITVPATQIIRSQSTPNALKNIQSQTLKSSQTSKLTQSFSGRLQSIRTLKTPEKIEPIQFNDEDDDIGDFDDSQSSPQSSIEPKSSSKTSSSAPKLLNISPTKDNDIEVTLWNPTPYKFRQHQKNTDECLSKIYKELTGADELEEEFQKLLHENIIRIPDDHELISKYSPQFVSVHDIKEPDIEMNFSFDKLKQKIDTRNHYNSLNQNNLYKNEKIFKCTLDMNESQVTEELDRKFDKDDFSKVTVVSIINIQSL